jgi:hypothetical protein
MWWNKKTTLSKIKLATRQSNSSEKDPMLRVAEEAKKMWENYLKKIDRMEDMKMCGAVIATESLRAESGSNPPLFDDKFAFIATGGKFTIEKDDVGILVGKTSVRVSRRVKGKKRPIEIVVMTHMFNDTIVNFTVDAAAKYLKTVHFEESSESDETEG